MSEHRTLKAVFLLAGLAVIVLLGLHRFKPARGPVASRESKNQPASARPRKAKTSRPAPLRMAAPAEVVQPAGPQSEMVKMLLGQQHSVQVSREDIAKYLADNRRSAASLLTAFGVSGEPAYLKEAAANFAGDPRLQLAVLMSDAFPEERRKWLGLFKQSAPDNSLASYLSARDHLQQGRFEPAIDDLLEASQRPRFQHYALEGMLNAQELLLTAGKSPAEAKVMAMLSASFPHLAQMKQLCAKMVDMQGQYNGLGDARSFEAMTSMGLTLAGRMNGPEGGKFIIDQRVGIAIETQFLKAFDPASAPEWLGKPVGARLAELAQQEKEMLRLGGLVGGVLTGANEAELITYFDRVKLEGEVAALRWLEAKYGGK